MGGLPAACCSRPWLPRILRYQSAAKGKAERQYWVFASSLPWLPRTLLYQSAAKGKAERQY